MVLYRAGDETRRLDLEERKENEYLKIALPSFLVVEFLGNAWKVGD